jgi:hypothetical protein
MKRRNNVASYLVAGAVVAGACALAPAVSVANDGHHHHDRSKICTGTLAAPGVLSGNYWSTTVIQGSCVVNGGAAVVHGNLIVTPGSNLVAAFANNDVAGTGTSSLKVTGDVRIGTGATAILGCEPGFFTCVDDPNQNTPTLSSADVVRGDIHGKGALGPLLHNSKVGGSVALRGGGGGVTCTPTPGSAFASFGSPDYSDLEDNSIRGDISVKGLQSCWFGALRNKVHGDVRVVHNTVPDPDAMEVVTNAIRGDLACYANIPAIQFGDSAGSPNVVGGWASGQCGLNVLIPKPEPSGPPTPVSIP